MHVQGKHAEPVCPKPLQTHVAHGLLPHSSAIPDAAALTPAATPDSLKPQPVASHRHQHLPWVLASDCVSWIVVVLIRRPVS